MVAGFFAWVCFLIAAPLMLAAIAGNMPIAGAISAQFIIAGFLFRRLRPKKEKKT